MKLRLLFLLLVMLVGVGIIPTQSSATSGGPLYLSVDLKHAPFEEALRQLFSGQMLGFANYVIVSGPAKDAVATIKIPNKPGQRTTATEALTQVLVQYNLGYRRVGRTIYIFRKGTQPAPETELLLYLRRNGDRTQLRLRAYPYENGGEKLLWESLKDIYQVAYILPSPSFQHLLLVWYGATWDESGDANLILYLLPVAGGTAKVINPPGPVGGVAWTNAKELTLSTFYGDELWRYHIGTEQWTLVSTKKTLEQLAYAAPRKVLEKLLRKVQLPFSFPKDNLEQALDATMSGQINPGANVGVAPQAAISPNGRYAALVGAEAAVYVFDVTTGAIVHKILPTRLVNTESVALGQLHWSPDSAHLLFTESHFHAARFYGMPDTPSITDWTDLVREYTPATGRIETMTVGSDAFRIPAEIVKQILAKSDPRAWQSADDQSRWGRYADQPISEE